MNKKNRFIILPLLILSCLLTGALLLGGIPATAEGELPAGDDKSTTNNEKDGQEKSYTISINGNSHFSDKDLLKAAAYEIQTFEEQGFRKADIDDAAYQMRSAYLQAGFPFAFVDYDYVETNSVMEVTFTVDEGPHVVIEDITFQGNKHIPRETLQAFFPKTDTRWGRKEEMFFIKSEVRDRVSKIRDYYRGEGFADVIVDKPLQTFNEERNGVSIIIPITEGPRHVIDEVVFKGDLIPELSTELDTIRDELEGRSYYARRRLFFKTSLKEAYGNKGYADAEFVIETFQEGEPGKITLQATIQSGERVIISGIVISGNKRTRERFIRNRVQFEPGDIYSIIKRRKSFRKLFETGLFKTVSIELSSPREDGRRDLAVAVEELPAKEFYFEPGWGSYEKLRARAGILEANLFGTGRRARLDGLISTKGEILALIYTDPWLLQTDVELNIPFYYERREEPSFESREIAVSTLFSRKMSRRLTLTAGYQYKIKEVRDLTDEEEERARQEGTEDYNKGTAGIQAVWDTRDDILYPSAGVRIASGLAISLPALGSDLEFGRVTLGCRYFIELPKSFILGLRATTGLIIPIRDQSFIPISERFFNGGDNTVRSYRHSQLGPKDSGNRPVGGLGYNVFSVELRKKLYRNLAGTLFIDAGNVSPNKSWLERDFAPHDTRSELMDDTLNDFFSEFKFGIGAGLQYFLPIGPARIDVAYNPDPEEIWDEKSWVFHFSLGMAF